ncbi:glycosyltransferase family 4 protein [Rhodomicrobium vannielii ATCC 17100]|uniref:glycosyltransferase family 4 protein n=1 Tax=Rhodomicrobium vannielii TaxID=1069 RepID=UPI00191A759E|nr:glycosyltransferase family 4 protein [Rhodomicrobium vannielii]MBJ7533244.1 glycosyltransferase family 4 protein [Rhodomicrobium vannielii ATCC 17100]
MKIGLLTKYGDMAASTRQRFQQYRPFLQESGFELAPRPLLDDAYLQKLYAGGRRDRGHVAARYLDRLRWLLSKPDVDVIWLHCELFAFLPGLVEGLVRWPNKPIVFDYDDAIFHNYDLHPNKLIRGLLGRKLHRTIGTVELALCGNAYLAAYARPLCPRTEIVPTVVDTTAYLPRQDGQSADGPVRIGWIGTPSTWNEYMVGLLPTLTQAAALAGGKLAAMGADPKTEAQPLLDLVEWSEAAEVPFLQAVDIGIMPLSDTPWARGKCGYKLIQYMACGLPVVASPVGVNAEIVEHGVNGFLATTKAEWSEALATLLRDPALRQRMGAAGRRKVEEHYSLQVWGPRVAALLLDVAEKSRA